MSSTFAEARQNTPTSPESAAAVEELRAAIRDLPPAHHEEVDRQLAEAAVQYQATRDPQPLIFFVESLLMTARLHRTPEYHKALAEAEQDTWGSDGVDVADMIAAANARRAGRR